MVEILSQPIMKYVSIDETNDLGKSLLHIAEHLAARDPSVVNFFTDQTLEDKILARMLEAGLKSGLATQKETQACNQLLGITDAL